MKKISQFLIFVMLLLLHSLSASAQDYPKNLIMIIGDGMGSEHLRAAEMYKGANLSFRSFPHTAKITTHSLDNSITDSAASGSAFATGNKVENGVVSTNTDETHSTALISFGESWKYFYEAGSPGGRWMNESFDDSLWLSANAQLGYGDGDEASVLDFGGDVNNKHITAYFRKTFTISDLSQIKDLRLKIIRDDGVRVFINGVELFRDNLPEGDIDNSTLAETAIGGSAEDTSVQPHFIDKALFKNGLNTIAVEVHQVSPTSSDISFDLALLAGEFEYKSLLEIYKSLGKATGLVTNTKITDATPAAFGAHELSRNSTESIAKDYILNSKPDILMGGSPTILTNLANTNSYQIVSNRSELLTITNLNSKLLGAFGTSDMPFKLDGLGNLPSLEDMTNKALKLLSQNPNGFFLLIENEHIDTTGHSNDIDRNVVEVVELDQVVKAALDWASTRNDTLILVTADHETGGLNVISDNGPGVAPTVTWSTFGHTATEVDLFASGLGADKFFGTLDNTDLIHILATILPEPTEPEPEQPNEEYNFTASYKMKKRSLLLNFVVLNSEGQLVTLSNEDQCFYHLYNFDKKTSTNQLLASLSATGIDTYKVKMKRMRKNRNKKSTQILSKLYCKNLLHHENNFQSVKKVHKKKGRQISARRWFRILARKL